MNSKGDRTAARRRKKNKVRQERSLTDLLNISGHAEGSLGVPLGQRTDEADP